MWLCYDLNWDVIFLVIRTGNFVMLFRDRAGVNLVFVVVRSIQVAVMQF